MASTMGQIEAAAGLFAVKRAALAEVCQGLTQALEEVKRRHLPALRLAAAEAKGEHAALCALIAESPELFRRPRSVVLHGVKLGYEKGKGSLEIADAAKTVELIKKHFPDLADVLIKTTEEPAKKALANLSATDLKKMAVTVKDTGDIVFAKDTAAEVDKLVGALLKDDTAEAEQAAEEPQRAAA